jgi:hypothetical protein
MVRLDPSKRKNVGAEQAKIFARSTPVARASAPATGETEPVVEANDVVLGKVEQKQGGKKNAGVAAAKAGVVARWKTSLKVGVITALTGLALLVPMRNAGADTVFLDHNHAPAEITMARQLAAEIGEKFFLVKPDKQSVERIFAMAERGEINLRHLILSGHSGGTSFSGKGEDGTSYETSHSQYQELKKLYPRAFAQVKHVTFLACYAGSMSNSAQWKTVFSNAITIGFHAIAPSKDRPASTQVLANTERYARQNIDGKNLTPAQMQMHARNMTKLQGPNITNFAVRVGDAYASTGEKVTSVDQAQDRVNLLRLRGFEPYFNPVGQPAQFANPPLSTQQSELEQYYRALQALRNILPADSYQLTSVTEQSEIALRLFHWQQVLRHAQQTYAELFSAAQQELTEAGITSVRAPSDVSILTRLQIVELANKLDALGGNMAVYGLAERHESDIALVNEAFSARNQTAFEMPTPSNGEYKVTMAKAQLKTLIDDATTAPAVREAAQKMIDSLNNPRFVKLTEAREIISKGLKSLSPKVIPQAWID